MKPEPCGFTTSDVVVYKNEHQPGQPYVVIRPGHSVRGPGAERDDWDPADTRDDIEEHEYYVELALKALEELDWTGINLFVFDRQTGGREGFRLESALVDKLGGPRCLDLQLHLNASSNRKAKGSMVAYTRGSAGGLRMARILLDNIKEALGTITFSDGLVANPSPDWPRLDLTRTTLGPSLVLEAGFLTNDDDFFLLHKRRENVLKAVNKSIYQYFGM